MNKVNLALCVVIISLISFNLANGRYLGQQEQTKGLDIVAKRKHHVPFRWGKRSFQTSFDDDLRNSCIEFLVDVLEKNQNSSTELSELDVKNINSCFNLIKSTLIKQKIQLEALASSEEINQSKEAALKQTELSSEEDTKNLKNLKRSNIPFRWG